MNFSIGLSAMQASQYAIKTGSHNIANANTAGYHRQRLTLAARAPQWAINHQFGSGVEINRVDRIRNQVLEGFFTQSTSELGGIREGLSVLRQIESEFLLGDGSIHQSISGFFSELTRLSASPNATVARDAVIYQATQISRQVNGINNRLVDMSSRVESQLRADVNTLNRELEELTTLHRQIEIVKVQGAVPNDLLDRRDSLVNKIAEKIDVDRYELSQNGLGLSIGSSSITIGISPPRFSVARQDDGKLSVVMEGTNREMQFQSGSIRALQDSNNITIPQYRAQLNEFARTFMREIDQQHAKGVGVNGAFELLRSSRMVKPTTLPLEQANLAFPVTAGELTVSITDPLGEKRTFTIQIDPAVDSLQAVANRLDAIDNLRAIVDPTSGQLSLFAQPGHRFDFTGNLETIPNLSGFTGSSEPRISGQYSGDRNRNLEVTIIGSGSVGTTPGLMARVTDADSGAVIVELPIGESYEAGSTLTLADGVTLSFEAGTVAEGDSFRTPLIKESDSTGILSALGLNSFFTGSDASDMRVSSRILDNPSALATSRNGDWSDTANLLGLISLRDKQVIGDVSMSFQDFLAETSASIGFEVSLQVRLETNLSGLHQQYQDQINAVSGVDLNEELLAITQFQKQYEASVQVLRTMDAMLAELLTLVR